MGIYTVHGFDLNTTEATVRGVRSCAKNGILVTGAILVCWQVFTQASTS